AAVASWLGALQNTAIELLRWSANTMAIYIAARLLAAPFISHSSPGDDTSGLRGQNSLATFLTEIFGWAVAGAFTGLLIGLGVRWLSLKHNLDVAASNEHGYGFMGLQAARRHAADWLAILGPPWILLSFLIGDAIYVGITSRSLSGERDREWLARAGGWLGSL